MRKVSRLTLLLLLLGSITLYWQDPLYKLGRNIEIFGRVLQELTLNYVDSPDLDKLTTRAVDAMLAELDPYTNFYSAAEVTQAQLEQSGQYAGVGLVLLPLEGKVVCRRILPGSPAEKAGIQPGDLLVEIAGRPAPQLTLEQIQQLLRGAPKTTVQVKILHPTTRTTQEITLTRTELEMEAVPYAVVLPGQVGYIVLTQFSRDCAQALRQRLIQLKSQTPLKGLIIDLRGNPGGLMNEALDILNFFLPKGELLLETRGRMPETNQKYYAQMHPFEPTLPIVVLIDERSASASEIVAGTLQDLDRAVVMGRRSFGKGLVQVVRPLVENTQMKITVSRYYTPSGRCIQLTQPGGAPRTFRTRNGRLVREGSGITPDIEYPAALPIEVTERVEPYFFYFLAQQRDKIPRDSVSLTIELPSVNMVEGLIDSLRNYPAAYAQTAEKRLLEIKNEVGSVPEVKAKVEETLSAFAEYRLGELRRQREALRVLVGQLRAYHGRGLTGEYDFIAARDPLVQEARQVLLDPMRYEKVLRP
ncbi:MAG: S41 family peptidase [Bacteroidia bacterium]|nr:S41 family peptidase [Bacteroidia bacterium]